MGFHPLQLQALPSLLSAVAKPRLPESHETLVANTAAEENVASERGVSAPPKPHKAANVKSGQWHKPVPNAMT